MLIARLADTVLDQAELLLDQADPATRARILERLTAMVATHSSTAARAEERGLVVHTDGACSNNQSGAGLGGWAFVISTPDGEVVQEGSGAERNTSNNRMELLSVLQGLSAVASYHVAGQPVVVVTDSKNVIGWLSQGWKRNNPDIRDLCAMIDPLVARFAVTFDWVKGHQGDPRNERCDVLAVEAAHTLR